jgi:hypothetical protein
VTAKAERRAWMALKRLRTLWFTTGTLCNLTCRNRLTGAEVAEYLDEIERDRLGTKEIGFAGGEPFTNPEFPSMLEDALGRGYRALVLTSAMRPMMKMAAPLLALDERYWRQLVVRVSLDHYSRALHELERGPRSWERPLQGLEWLAASGFLVHVAGRRRFSGEPEPALRAGYGRLFREHALPIEAGDPVQLVLFRERTQTLREASGAVPLNHPHCARFCVRGGASCSAAG